MGTNLYNRNQRIKNRIKGKKKKYTYILLFLFTIFLFFIFSENIKVDENTGGIKIVKTNKIIKEDFEETYSGAVYKGLPFDIDIDIKNVYLTGTTVDIFFSNNSDFVSNEPYKNGNLNQIRYGFMLGKIRNRDKVFYLGKNLNSLNKITYNLNQVYEEDDNLGFKVANLEGSTLFVKIHIKGEKIYEIKKQD